MQLNKAKLIEAIDDGIERAKAQQIDWDARVDAAEAEWERLWREVKLPRWKDFRDHLTKALKSGGKVDARLIPTEKRGYDQVPADYRPFNRGRWNRNFRDRWESDHEFGPRPVLKIAPFETLKDFLETVDDDTISTNQLERAGFRSLNKLFEAAANGYWSQ
ncbi:hypothetical protein K8O93_00850 [Gordonia bronchialis]|uniref:hypothetical protein n=1 Tax=Gordonia bronchialis TaxID=2054 RepID=UPI001CBE2D4A|nr:hypothetical protein [Gordonia bronchialis]UAK38381.1 hypothetical protein K8O93_00850 [Gordonia bronchialis]